MLLVFTRSAKYVWRELINSFWFITLDGIHVMMSGSNELESLKILRGPQIVKEASPSMAKVPLVRRPPYLEVSLVLQNEVELAAKILRGRINVFYGINKNIFG